MCEETRKGTSVWQFGWQRTDTYSVMETLQKVHLLPGRSSSQNRWQYILLSSMKEAHLTGQSKEMPATSVRASSPEDSAAGFPCPSAPARGFKAKSNQFHQLQLHKSRKIPNYICLLEKAPLNMPLGVSSLCVCVYKIPLFVICSLQCKTWIKQCNCVCFNKAILSSCLMIHGVKWKLQVFQVQTLWPRAPLITSPQLAADCS